MKTLQEGWRIQSRVIGALMIREMTTRFGRQNIGFLWIMAEPLLFAGLVAMIWHFMRGNTEHGVSVVAFTVSGYIPLVLFRSAVNRSVLLFQVNGSLMYHRQIKIIDFVFVRYLLELIGHLMAYIFIGVALHMFGFFPTPYDLSFMLLGGLYYAYFALAASFVLAPLSEMSETIEKLVPVVTYIMIPFSGAFNMVSWVVPQGQEILMYSPPVHAMEMMRYGLFGDVVQARFDYFYPFMVNSVFLLIGLTLCRRVRRHLVVE